MHIATTDGTGALLVSPEQLALCRALLDLPVSTQATLAVLLAEPRRIAALLSLADAQLALESLESDPIPGPVDGRLQHPIPCPTRRRARDRGDDVPVCTWVRDCGGYTCTVEDCQRWEPADMPRGACIAARLGDPPAEEPA